MTPSPLVGCINCIWSPSKASYWHTATMRGANRCQKSFIYYNNCYLHIVCNVASTPLAVLKPWWDNPPIRSTIWGLFKGDLDWQIENGQSFWHVCNRESTQAWKNMNKRCIKTPPMHLPCDASASKGCNRDFSWSQKGIWIALIET